MPKNARLDGDILTFTTTVCVMLETVVEVQCRAVLTDGCIEDVDITNTHVKRYPDCPSSKGIFERFYDADFEELDKDAEAALKVVKKA